MALNGSVSTSAYEGRYLTLSWSASQSISDNVSTISWTLSANGGSSSYYYTGPVTVTIDGTTVYSLSGDDRYAMYKGTVKTGTIKLKHSTTGAKSFTVSIRAAIYTYAVNCTGEGTFTLNNIPRYPSVSQTLASATETSITMNWSSDSTCDYLWYSKDAGTNWTAYGGINGASGQYTISGLTAGTTYNIKTRLRRKDSQLTSDAPSKAITTYSYPYANSMPNFNIGDSVTIGVYNPLGRSYTLTMIAEDGTEITTDREYTGTSVSGFEVSTYTEMFYNSIPNARSGRYSVRINYGNITETREGGIYSAPVSSAPLIGGATYLDADSTITAITGDNKKVIPGMSKLTFNATGITAQNYATISSVKVNVGTEYDMTVSGSTATASNVTVGSSETTTAIITVTDSRGLAGTFEVALDTVDYAKPTMTASVKRSYGYYSNTDITPTTNYTYVGSNAVTIQLQARKTSETSYSITQTISSSTTTTISFDNEYAWYLRFTITDSFGSSSTYTVTLGKGVPLFYFDTQKSSVSMDMFPTHANAFEVNGDVYINTNKLSDFVVEESINTTSGNWSWRKWASGTAECWGRFPQASAINTAMGDNFSSADFTTDLPTGLFMGDTPQVNCNITYGTIYCWPICTGNPSTTSVGKWRAFRITANTNTQNKFYVFKVVGRWK